MKILLIYLGRRGAGPVYSLELSKILSRENDFLAIISKNIQNKNEWKEADINYFEIDTFNNIFELFVSSIRFKKFINLKSLINKFSPDIVFYPMIHIWTPILNYLLKKYEIYTTVHDPDMHLGEKNYFLNIIYKLSIKSSDRFIVLSNKFKKYLSNKYKIKEDLIYYIPHGNFSYYKKFSNSYKLENKENKKILFFGRIVEYKGLDILLDAYEIIKTKLGNEVSLMIVGEGDLLKYKEKIKNERDIEVVNRWIDDKEIHKYFEMADIVVLPYKEASQSGIIPLAYAFSKSVIATRVGGIEEQVDDGITGFLVKPNDSIELAQKCIELIKNDDLRYKMSLNAKLKNETDLSWEKIGEMHIEVFKEFKNR